MIVGCPFCGTLHEETEERAQSPEPMDRACAKCYLADKARDTTLFAEFPIVCCPHCGKEQQWDDYYELRAGTSCVQVALATVNTAKKRYMFSVRTRLFTPVCLRCPTRRRADGEAGPTQAASYNAR